MISSLISFLSLFIISLLFGLGIGFTVFGVIYCHRAFRGESVFENPFFIQAISFVFIVVGLTLLFLILLILA